MDADGRSAICPSCEHEFTIVAPTIPARDTQAGSPNRLAVRSMSIEAVLSGVARVHGRRQSRLYLPFLVAFGSFFCLGILPLLWLSEQWNTGAAWAGSAAIAMTPGLFCVAVYALWSAFVLAHRVCLHDAEEPTARDWLLPSIKAYVSLGVITLGAFVGIAIVIFAARAVSAYTAGATSTGTILLLWTVYGLAALAITIAAMTICWPLFPLAFLGRLDRAALRYALAVSLSNWMTSLLLVLVVVFLLLAGFAFLVITLAITMPLAALVLMVALLEMEDALPDD